MSRDKIVIKGAREHVTLLHQALVPLFTQLQVDRRATTWERPEGAGRQWAGARWFRFLRDCGLKSTSANACFHSLRVTAISEMIRAKVPENLVRKFVGHASITVNRGYQRIKPDDLSACANAIV